MPKPHNDEGSIDADSLYYILWKLIELPDNSVYHLSSIVAATEASRLSSAVLPMGGSAIASSSQPVPCSTSNSNSNSNNITDIIDIPSGEIRGLVDGNTIL
jgi:hypothetical protein